MATARVVAGQSGKPKLTDTFFTVEEVAPVHHRQHPQKEDSFTFYSFSSDRSVSLKHDFGRRKKSEDGEIDIFPAEKYYNGDIVVDSIGPRLLTPSVKEAEETISRNKSVGTPSICSQSSRNSRSALLCIAKKELPPPKSLKSIRRRRLGNILRCSCSGDKSIEVEANGSNPSNSPDQIRGKKNNLAIVDTPIYPSAGRTLRDTKGSGNPKNGFGSPVLNLKVRSTRNDEDDDRSESSSELFEIESFSTRYPQFHPTSRAMSEATVTAYTPSEASIEWSVATASAVNFSDWADESPKLKNLAAASKRSQRPGLFKGCISSRAVDVSSSVYRVSEKGGVDWVQTAELIDREKIPVFRRYELHSGNRQVVEVKSAGIGRVFGSNMTENSRGGRVN